MKVVFQLAMAVFGVGVLLPYASQAQNDTCTAEYAALAEHTMCLVDDPSIIRSGVSDADIQTIVNLHNKLRGEIVPPATNLVKLVWHPEIARVAQKWANHCKGGHDANRKVPSLSFEVGQNMAGGQSTWENAIMGWYNEIQYFKYGEDPNVYNGPDGWRKIEHFTQIVQSTTYLIGCGFAECENYSHSKLYVCNYAGGNYNMIKPYRNGTRCIDCVSCKEGVCDCNWLACHNGGTLDMLYCRCKCTTEWKGRSCQEEACPGHTCLNGGTMNIDTCKCECPPIYTGTSCETLACPDNDMYYCGSGWPEYYCFEHKKQAEEACPYMCKLCSDPNACTSGPCKNGGVCTDGVNDFSCTCPEGFEGKDCSINHDDCNLEPCKNNGTCTDGVNDYSCSCPFGFSGKDCSVNDNCKDLVNCESYATSEPCTKYVEWSKTNCPKYCKFCYTNKDECESNPCTNGATCTNLVNDFSCECPPGFNGKDCSDSEVFS